VNDEHDGISGKKHRRGRSGTQGSESTMESMRSRGDLFPSEDEDDAVPLDDEFALALERRTTKSWPDDTSSGKTGSGKRASRSRTSTKTDSLLNLGSPARRRGLSAAASPAVTSPTVEDAPVLDVPTLDDIKREDERIHREEEAEIERKRVEARKLARERGLSNATATSMSVPNDRNRSLSAADQPLQTSAFNNPSKASEAPESPAKDVLANDVEFVPARLPNF